MRLSARGRSRGPGDQLRFAALAALAALALAASAETLVLPVPSGVLPPEVPADNPPTTAKVELGKKLYFDTRLSTDGSVACATCHDPRHGFADPRGKPTSAGVGGALGTRNAPTVLNAAFLASQFWDGRAATLEEQAVQPLVNPDRARFRRPGRGAREAEDARRLPAALPGRVREPGDQHASASARRSRASSERCSRLDAPIDRFLAGDTKAISASAQRGWELYNAQGALQHLPRAHRGVSALHRRPVPQHRRRREAHRLRRGRAQGGGERGGREVHRRARPWTTPRRASSADSS